MNVNQLLEATDHFRLMTECGESHHNISGIYSCDLLSWVMSHANKQDAWLTVQGHANIVAVASLLELSCIIIVEGAPIEDDTIEKANEHKIPILATQKSAYEVITLLNSLEI